MHIALLWHTIGHGNLGIDALARSNTAILRSAARRASVEPRFTLLGDPTRGDTRELPPDVTPGPAPRIKPLLRGNSDFMRVIRSADLVVDIGEGDSFTDIYGMTRFGFQVGTRAAAVLAGKPLVMAPQTIGPFERSVSRALAAPVLKRARAVFTRDALSSRYVHSLSTSAMSAEFIDVAFALPYEVQSRESAKIRVGLNVSGLLYNGGYTGRNEFGLKLDYRSFTDRLIETLVSTLGVEVHLIAHVFGDGSADDDWPVVMELTKRYPAVRAAPRFSAASAAKSYMSGLDFMIGGRMHACIGAFSAGVPVVPVAYSRKFNGLFDTLDYPFYIDGKTQTTETALAFVADALARRHDLEQRVKAGNVTARSRLAAYEDALVALISKVKRDVDHA